MPGVLSRIDEPWGITWRAKNLVHRASLRRGLRFLWGYASGVEYHRPVFVLGAPRSATTMLFELLKESPELSALPGEGHDIWRALHHPRYSGWRSDALGADDVRRGEHRFVGARFYAQLGRGRLLEKTPENSLRLPYLLELFPDASFVVVRRNPCDTISSLIDGWRHPAGRFRSYFVPKGLTIPGYPHRRRWCFALIEGWREYASQPIHQIAFAQWDQCTRALQEARPLVSPANWIEFALEEVLEDPDGALTAICERVGIARGQALERRLPELLVNPANALSPPSDEKWRARNPREIEDLLPRIATAARGRGYTVNPQTGSFSVELPFGTRVPG
jgi:hypothetical protein